ncbi:MAG: hypothetical protein K2X66_01590 [Cyanobacteria bacterium]|nr:hypothetical protein [Cyanobacteriota bacterium]
MLKNIFSRFSNKPNEDDTHPLPSSSPDASTHPEATEDASVIQTSTPTEKPFRDNFSAHPAKDLQHTLPDQAPMVTVYDQFGREFQIPQQEWIQLLPEQLKHVWENPDALYELIFLSMQGLIFQELLPGAERLVEIDPNPERSFAILSILQMNSGLLDEAESTFNTFFEAHGRTAVMLTNYAKLHFQRQQTPAGQALIEEALKIDPNQDIALDWWLALNQEQGGLQQREMALTELAKQPLAWRPQLLQGRDLVENGKIDEALSLFKETLDAHPENPEYINLLARDLGTYGKPEAILSMILPVFDPALHGPVPAVHILQAFLDTMQLENGEAFLHAIRMQQFNNLDPVFMQFSDAFDQLRAQTHAETFSNSMVQEGRIAVQSVVLSDPIWYYALNEPDWLLPYKQNKQGGIGFLVFANTTPSNVDSLQVESEDDVGRLTRSIPIYLSEIFNYKTSFHSLLILPVIQDLGPLVYKKEWEWQDIETFAKMTPTALDFLVTGCIEEKEGGTYELLVSLWNMNTQAKDTTFRLSDGKGKLHAMIPALTETLLNQFPTHWVIPPDFYESWSLKPRLGEYLTTLNQLFSLLLVKEQLLKKELFIGERQILENFFNLALELGESQNPKILFLAGLCLDRSIHSMIYREYQLKALELLSFEENRQSLFFKLSPMLLEVLGMREERNLRGQELLESLTSPLSPTDEKYKVWLERLLLT